MIENTDNRCSEITKALLSYLDKRLYEWATWFSQKTPLGVGYPPQSLEYRLMTEGQITREYLGKKPMPINSDAEEIERFIQDMMAQNQEMGKILCHYYMTLGDLPHKARHLGYTEKQFRKNLECARWWLVSRLTMNKKLHTLILHH